LETFVDPACDFARCAKGWITSNSKSKSLWHGFGRHSAMQNSGGTPMSLGHKFIAKLRAFARARNANVAMIFGLSLIPIAIAAGAGLDFGRAMIVRTRLAEALDAAGLAVGATTGLTTSQMQALAQKYFNANYTADSSFGTPAAVVISTGAGSNGATTSVTLSTSVPMPTTLMNVVGMKTMNIGYSSQVVWGQTKLWVALALDNTGSMCQSDSSPNAASPCSNPSSGSKIAVLKTATTSLLTTLKGAAQNSGDVMVSIVPFTTAVNVGTSNKSATWLTYAPWDATGTGDGSYQNHQTCTGSGRNQHCTTTQVWVANDSDHSTWTGCVMDRNQDYDTMNTTPTAGSTATLFPAAPGTLASNSNWSLTCPTQLIGLTDVLSSTGWTKLNSTVTNMSAGGATNQTIGLAWAWQTMTDGNPMNSGSLPQYTSQILIILSDGLNTQDRWTGNGSTEDSGTDTRMTKVCTNAKAAGITIYAVFVDIGGTQGNSSVLANCATDANHYFDLTSASQITTAFNEIATQITQLRVAK
jgi:Flp pilus assembly protein TadG